MAYKFQAGEAILSGNLLQEGDVEIETGFSLKVHEQTILDTSRNLGNVGTISGSGQISGPSLAVDLDATVGADIIMQQGGNVYLAGDGGSAKILSSGGNAVSIFGAKVVTNGSSIEPDSDNGTDLGSSSKEFKDLYLDGVAYIDDLRADQLGAALDANSQAITNINVDSGAIDGTVIGANSVAAGSFAALVGTTGTFSGVLKTDDATEATTTTDGSLQTDGGLSVAKSAVIGDDLDLLSDAAIVNFGADKDVNLTHVADTGLLLNSSMQLQFGDSGTYIHQSADGVLDLVSDTEIEINATTVDINGAIDASSTIVAASSITAGSSFIIGSADLNETDMEKLDGITNGTAAANKAVVVDANKDISSLRDISGRDLTLSGLNEGLVTFAQSNGKLGDDDAMAYNDDGMGGGKFFQVRSRGPVGNNFTGIMAKTASISVLNAAEDGLLAYVGYDGALSASSKLEVGGTVQFDGVADAAMVASDSMYFLDSDGKMKRDLASDVRNLFFSAVSGDATVAAGGALTIEADAVEHGMLNDNVISGQTELAADGLAAADELLISDAGTLKKIGVDNLFMDGPGLLTEAALAVADDYIMFLDGGATGDAKKESVSDLMASVAGTGLKAASGVLALDAQELSQAAVASGDFFVFEDATDNSTKKESVDDLATLFAGTGLAAASAVLSLDLNELGAATVAVGDDSIAIIDATDNSTKKESITDLVAAMAGSGLSATNGVLSTQGSSVAVAVDGGTLSEGYNFATGSLSLSVTLPSGSAGDVIHVKAAALGDDQTLTINRAGSQTIDGQTSVVLESQYAAVSLVYVTDNDWRII